MVKCYPDGNAFMNENTDYLNENRFLSAFFILDAPFLTEVNRKDYALGVFSGDKRLLALKVGHYNLMLYGDEECMEELLEYIRDNDLETAGVLCTVELGDSLMALSHKMLGKEYYQQIGMDFMTAEDITEESSSEVSVPSEDDVDELFACSADFITECGLTDKPVRERIAGAINGYRVIRRDGMIVSFARKSPDTDISERISYVYTRPQYRGQKLARKIVNNLKNEIIREGKTATLNVDRANPISNHLYESLGFRKLFSQGIYQVRE